MNFGALKIQKEVSEVVYIFFLQDLPFGNVLLLGKIFKKGFFVHNKYRKSQERGLFEFFLTFFLF